MKAFKRVFVNVCCSFIAPIWLFWHVDLILRQVAGKSLVKHDVPAKRHCQEVELTHYKSVYKHMHKVRPAYLQRASRIYE